MKMTSRIGAAVSPLLKGPHRRYISEATSANPSLTFFNGDGHSNWTLVDLHVQGISSQKRSSHSSALDEDDDFSELGSPLVQGAAKPLKLVTQKPEPCGTWNSDPVKKHFSGKPLPAESSSRVEHVVNSRIGVSSRADDTKSGKSRKSYNFVVDPNLVLGSKSRSKLSELKASNTSKSTSISVEDFPSEVGPSHLPIRPQDVSETVAIKIKNISSGTGDAAIHSACMSFGLLEGLARTKEDTVEAVYIVKSIVESQSILQKLNDSITDGHRWSAYLLERDSTNNEDANCKLGLQISSHLAELKRQVCMKKIEVEDLEYLHSCIAHLEESPGISN